MYMSIIVEKLVKEIMLWQNTTSSPKVFLQKLNFFREKMTFWPLFYLHLFFKPWLYFTMPFILHDKHNRQV